MSGDERQAALVGLISGEMPVDQARRRLSGFGWDSETPLVVLTPHDLVRMLDLYLGSTIRGSDLEEWAEAIEGRDDVGYEGDTADMLRGAVFELANPDLTTQLVPERARELRNRFGNRTWPQK